MRRLLFLLLLFISSLTANEFAIIVNAQTNIDHITKQELERIFLSKTRRLPDGKRAKPVEVAAAALKSSFYEAVAHKSGVELRSYWATLIFTGMGMPPKQMRSHQQVVEYVKLTPGAIAYVEKSKLDASVKVIALRE